MTVSASGLAYDEAGAGPVVVLTHASLVDRRMWRAQLAALSRHHRVIAWDQRGYGESVDPPPQVRHGADLLQLLDELEVERAAFVGCSMGGGYSLDAALLAPDRVERLALICTGVPGYRWPEQMGAEVGPLLHAAVPGERLTRYAAHTADVVLDEDITAMAEMQLRYMAVGPDRPVEVFDPDVWSFLLDMTRDVFARMWRGPLSDELDPDPPILDRLDEVTVPTLLITGGSDVRFIREVSDLVAAGIPAAQRIDLDDTGHLPPVERPEETNALLSEWLAG